LDDAQIVICCFWRYYELEFAVFWVWLLQI
jgi:hypothetical protein